MAATAHSIPLTPADASAGAPLAAAAECSAVELRQAAQDLAAAAMPAAERFQRLEILRAQALELLVTDRSRYAGQPLPLTDDQRTAWEGQIALWQSLYIGYALCTDIKGDEAAIATVWQRALDNLGRAIREHTRIYRLSPTALWKELNSCYRAAEACGLDVSALSDPASSAAAQTCKRTYLLTLLHEAANLFACSPAQANALERHLPDWVQQVDLRAVPPEGAARSPLAVDLQSVAGARLARELAPAEHLRYVDTSVLATRLRELAVSLREQRDVPELAQLLRELPRLAVERLLTHLYVQWCSAGTGRIDERRDAVTRAQVAVTMHAIHFQISGRAFRQPGLRYTREEEHDLATFGHITERTEQRLLTGRSSALEPWEIVNQSMSGSLGMLRKGDLASRIGHGQLIAVRTSSASAPALAVVQRLRLENDGALNVGARVIHGEVRGVAVRIFGASTDKYERALVVSDEDKKTPPTLITATGQFPSGALVEMYTTRAETIQVGEVIERGCDYERVAFSQA